MEKSGKRLIDEIGDKMKAVESACSGGVIPSDKWYVIRLDGHKFSNYATKFPIKPFDQRFADIMMKTLMSLMAHATSHPVLGHCHSDEITLVYRPCVQGGHPFSGRMMKIATLMAGQCSSFFYMHLLEEIDKHPELKEAVGLYPPSFDARILIFEEPKDVLDHAIWRTSLDCWRNFVSSVARHIHGKKLIHGKNVSQMLDMIRGHELFESASFTLKHGVFVRGTLVFHQGVDPRAPEKVIETIRHVLQPRTVHISTRAYADENLAEAYIDLLLSPDRLWPYKSDLDSREIALHE